MKYSYNILTPFSRFQNLCQMRDHIASIRVATWHLICEKKDIPFRMHIPEWMRVVECDPMPAGWFPASWKPNWFADHVELNPDARYLLLNDDDFYEPGFFQKIDEHDGEVVICSMKRGHNTPPGSTNGPETLNARPQELHQAGIGGEQIIVSGRVLKEFRFGPPYDGDWTFISAVTAKYPPVFVPDAFVWFNYLEPGRWNA